ncbi:urokinase plasminogen activator surface receptor [Oryzias melastigma]|uniref:Urokinase plasminogen activator surface receptor-like n=1 Tax=Oryzias melastigma TaxID=30732 RepID=A0A3B3CH93_ORYME|nr:urokinase plasminogen activator surface receptor [Oryzias melastigma]
MHFFIVLLGIWILPRADALKCYECIPELAGEACTKQTECSSAQQCASIREVNHEGGAAKGVILSRRCIKSDECGESSFSYGDVKTYFKVDCCNTDLCNTKPASEPTKYTPNKMKCFGCVGLPCNRTLNCEKNQDRCLISSVTIQGKTTTAKGCATSNICSNPTFLQENKNVGEIERCCEGEYCNSATTATASLLAVPLISLVLFS